MFADIAFWAAAYSPIRFRRTRELLLADGNDSVGFCAVSTGHMRFVQYGDERHVLDGVFVSAADPYSVTTAGASSTLAGVRLPRQSLAGLVPDLDDALARPMPPGNEALKLLKRYVGVLNDPSLACPVLRQPIVTHICDLAALALDAGRDCREIAKARGLSAARLHAIKADILAASGRPGLTLAALAVRHGVSPRYVQMLFEGEGLTFSQFLLDQRLNHAHRMLNDPRSAGRTITTIAYDSGFGDVSYFNRAFRRRYGESPSDVRASARIRGGLSPG
jgi:AraC-like DNA-binding protein